MSYQSIRKLQKAVEDKKTDLFRVIIEEDMSERGVSFEDSFHKMSTMWEAMKTSVSDYDGTRRSNSNLSGGDGLLFFAYKDAGKAMTGDFVADVVGKAISVAESNACMKRIVAAPTAGSCGVLPAVLTAYVDQYQVQDEKIIQALFVAAGIGEVIAARASISGAECGCQAEIGSASAMAACALVYLQGGDFEAIVNGGALALKNLLGLTCDPVGGYVEVPCVKRNAMGAVNAVTSADLSLAGIRSVIPFDEVIDAMGEIGKKMHEDLKETARGGLATTKTGKKYR